MMLELKVNLDDATLQRIHRLAKEHGHSFDQEVEAILLKAVPEKKSRAERVRRANEIAAMTPKDRVQTDSTVIIREHRQGRS